MVAAAWRIGLLRVKRNVHSASRGRYHRPPDRCRCAGAKLRGPAVVSFTAVPDAAVFVAVSKASACQPTLAAKVEFLSRPASYLEYRGEITRLETHMSWVFLTNERAYKLKKPVRFPYLDFSTLALRETACRAELKLNRRLAPGVYLDIVSLAASATGLSIGGAGDVVDWLVVMRRLDEHHVRSGACRAPREILAD
jgi:hypothetical protein